MIGLAIGRELRRLAFRCVGVRQRVQVRVTELGCFDQLLFGEFEPLGLALARLDERPERRVEVFVAGDTADGGGFESLRTRSALTPNRMNPVV